MREHLISGLFLCSSWILLVHCLHEHCDTYSGNNQKCTKRKDFGIKENERRILLIGKTGVGKSTTGNTILGNETFEAKASSDSVTSQIKIGHAERYDRKLLVVDTPGLFDTGKTNDEVMIEIAKCYGVTTPGLHAIVLVVRAGRFTEEEKKTIELFLTYFGENLSNYMILVFTYKERLEREGKTIEDYVKMTKNRDFRKLIAKIEHRYMAFGYKGNQHERENEVKTLLDMIDELNDINGGNYYTNEMYIKAEQIMNKRLAEEQLKLNEKHEAEINEALQSSREEHAFDMRNLDDKIAHMKQEMTIINEKDSTDKIQNEATLLEIKLKIEKEKEEYEMRIDIQNQKNEELIKQKEEKHKNALLKQEEKMRKEARRQAEQGSGNFFNDVLVVVASVIVVAIKFLTSWW